MRANSEEIVFQKALMNITRDGLIIRQAETAFQ